MAINNMNEATPVSSLSRRRMMHLMGAGIGLLAHENLFAAAAGRVGQSTTLKPPSTQIFQIDAARTGGEITPLLFGHNLEHTRRAVWQGLSAQMLANRKFTGASVTDRKAATAEHGFFGRLRTDGEPGSDGVAAHWYGIGNSWTNFFVDDELPFAGRTSQRLDVTTKDLWGGVGQQGIDLLANTRYELRIALRTHFGMKARVQVCDSSGRSIYFQEEKSWTGNEWHIWTAEFTPTKSDPEAQLEITFEGLGSAWLGAASLLPALNFNEMRPDVIALLKDMSVPVLRWPGGNFTRNWIWKDGLLPVDRRPPVLSKSHETLSLTDNYDFHEIAIDDFLALCAELGAVPSLTLNITDSVQNACDLVEYCNGPVSSKWGKMRAERGHPAPYGVKYWSIGNENFGYWMGPAYFPAEEYGEQAKRFAEAMLKVDPSIVLVGCGFEQGYTEKMVAIAGKNLDLVSAHHYHFMPEAQSTAGITDLDIARKVTLGLRQTIGKYRAEVDKGSAPGTSRPPISLDEWNIWHWWFVRPLEDEWHSGPLDGMYVASALNLFCREAGTMGLHSAMFFQPVNEGCIAVQPHGAHLTAAGQAFRVFQAHHGNLRIETPMPKADEYLDLCASIDRARNRLIVTLLNRDSEQSRPARLQMARVTPTAIKALALSPKDVGDPDSVFEENVLEIRQTDDGWEVDLPSYSIARFEVAFQ